MAVLAARVVLVWAVAQEAAVRHSVVPVAARVVLVWAAALADPVVLAWVAARVVQADLARKYLDPAVLDPVGPDQAARKARVAPAGET